ncbi:MAG: glycosyltransferase, partial [Actinomycetota bacterium]|nr:glycosyltransferase [Actinomycetota bacterium]
MTRHIAPENDYTKVLGLDLGPEPEVAVVIPVYNRVDLLRNALNGLVAQTYPAELIEVIVADDGSDEDVGAVVSEVTERLQVTLLRQEHEGNGAGTARNMGAAHTAADVLVFIDADCIPDPQLIAQHVDWHRRADNLVVIGSRHHLDTSDVASEDLIAGSTDLRIRATAHSEAGDALLPDDWRRVFYRRTGGLRSGDEAFRSLVSSNFSIRRESFVNAGGFSEAFIHWGAEDTELGWRLFNDGLFFVPENSAVIYHQIQEEEGDSPGWRRTAREANDGIIQARIPHRFYRKSERGYIYKVPKVTWIVSPTVPDRAAEVWDQILRQSFTDFEAVFLGGDVVVDQLGEKLVGDPRFAVIPPHKSSEAQFLAALERSRGEYVAVLHGWASLDHRLLSRAVRRLDANPRSSIARCGYQVVTGEGESVYLYDEAVADIDAAWQPDGLPVFALVRRREWAKVAGEVMSVSAMWRTIQELSDTRALRDALVALPALTPGDALPDRFPAITGERTHLVDDLTKGGPKRAVQAAGRFALSKARRRPYRPIGLNNPGSKQLAPSETQSRRPGVTYIGWLGRQNFGDETMLQAVQQLLPDATVGYDVADRRLLMLGGGTLINRLTYLEALRRHDSPRLE